MRIRMLTDMAGPGLYRECGQEIDEDDNTAMRLIAAGAAESIVATRAPEPGQVQEFRDKMRLTPQRYLELYPSGPNAKWARELVGA